MNIADLRKSYSLETLSEHEVPQDPFEQFSAWFEEALRAHLYEPNAMTLATADAAGRPSARTVLLKDFDNRGLVWYTNYESRKGQELAANPQAALLFWWAELERQVRIEGRVEQLNRKESEAYFKIRPVDSQMGAWASPQSRVISGRSELEERMASLKMQYADQPDIPMPPYWGGYRLAPDAFEFWQGRESRLHDRVLYRKEGENWIIERLAP